MVSPLFGLEAELALSARKGSEGRVPLEWLTCKLVETARRELPHLSGSGSRMFLSTGGLFYVDAGFHPEVATPECVNPYQAVAHLRCAEAEVAKMAMRVRRASRLSEVFVSRCNVDYLSGSTWGCHESYLTRRPVEYFENWLVPFLVSRVYTGAGGLDPSYPGIRFSLSPRVARIDEIKGGGRAIFNTRDESLSSLHKRLHVVVGDNSCSQLSQVLKIGSTALVIALAETQQNPPLKFLRNPLSVLRRFVHDLKSRTDVQLPGGRRRMTSLEIQNCYLEQIEANTSRLPEWAEAFCQLWRTTLEDVSLDPTPLAFDWGLKRTLLDREIERTLGWETVSSWNDILDRARLPEMKRRSGSQHLTQILNMTKSGNSDSEGPLTEANEALKACGLEWSGLSAFSALRERLCEIDVRCGLVHAGVFDTLDRRGLLTSHRVISDAEFEAASRPPKETRAHLRGQWVTKLSNERDLYRCSWEGIFGQENYLDLDDPFVTQAEWKPKTAEGGLDEHLRRTEATHYSQRTLAYDLYCSGQYAEAEAILTRLLEAGFEIPGTRTHLARVCLVTDQFARTMEHVSQAWAACDNAPAYVLPRIIWLQLALEFLNTANAPEFDLGCSTNASFIIGKLKTALQNRWVVHMWNMSAVLERLEPPCLDSQQHALLAALVEAMSNRDGMMALEALELWRAETPQPLDRVQETADGRLELH